MKVNPSDCQTSRNRSKRIAIAIAVAIPICIPFWGECFVLRRRAAEISETASDVRSNTHSVALLRTELDADRQRLSELRERLVPTSETDVFQNKLVEMVRHSGCVVRNLHVGEASRRLWQRDDNPTIAPEEDDGDPTGYELHTMPITIYATGSMQSVIAFIRELHLSPVFHYVRHLDLSVDESNVSLITVHIDIFVFDFKQAQAHSFDDSV